VQDNAARPVAPAEDRRMGTAEVPA
jgi:hypothetical protein